MVELTDTRNRNWALFQGVRLFLGMQVEKKKWRESLATSL